MFGAASAAADPPWVDRHVTMRGDSMAFDVGVGIAHQEGPPQNPTGAGLNLEVSGSPLDGLEFGIRSGFRFGTDGQVTQADAYGRLFDRPTFGTNNDVAANPELRIRGALLRGRVVEVGLEGRAFLPAEAGSQFGMMLGVPLLFRIDHAVRIDTGVFAPVVFYSPVQGAFSVPLDIWIQATNRFWVGPMTGVVFYTVNNRADAPFGLGLGYQISAVVDLKAQVLFPEVNEPQGAQNVGFGVGIQARVE
jgi:hypothetical protein